MKIGLTGASGFIGRRLIALAVDRGIGIIAFSRDPKKSVPGCDETRRFSTGEPLEVGGLDAVIHLAGENVFGLWTRRKRERIRQSRVLGTRMVVDGFRRARPAPDVLVSSSAVGFYGDTGERAVDESAPRGRGFLAKVAAEWEGEALKAREIGARVVTVRTGIVLGQDGGALAAMAPVFRLGAGGKLGSGRQWMSWIQLDDIARLYLHAVEELLVEGALNGVSPDPVRNAEFTRTLARVLHRPAFFGVPAWVLRLALGGFSAELLDSKRVEPTRTLESGFAFRNKTLESALTSSLEEQ